MDENLREALQNNVFIEILLKNNRKIKGKVLCNNSNAISIKINGRGSPEVIPIDEIDNITIVKEVV